MKFTNLVKLLLPAVVNCAYSKEGHCPYKPGELKMIFENKALDNFEMEKVADFPWMTVYDDVHLINEWVCPSIRLAQMKKENEFLYMFSNQISDEKR